MARILVFTESSATSVKNVTLEILGKLSGQSIEVASIGDIPADWMKALAAHVGEKIIKIEVDKLFKY